MALFDMPLPGKKYFVIFPPPSPQIINGRPLKFKAYPLKKDKSRVKKCTFYTTILCFGPKSRSKAQHFHVHTLGQGFSDEMPNLFIFLMTHWLETFNAWKIFYEKSLHGFMTSINPENQSQSFVTHCLQAVGKPWESLKHSCIPELPNGDH